MITTNWKQGRSHKFTKFRKGPVWCDENYKYFLAALSSKPSLLLSISKKVHQTTRKKDFVAKTSEHFFFLCSLTIISITDLNQPLDLNVLNVMNSTFEPRNGSHFWSFLTFLYLKVIFKVQTLKVYVYYFYECLWKCFYCWCRRTSFRSVN